MFEKVSRGRKMCQAKNLRVGHELGEASTQDEKEESTAHAKVVRWVHFKHWDSTTVVIAQ